MSFILGKIFILYFILTYLLSCHSSGEDTDTTLMLRLKLEAEDISFSLNTVS